MIKAIALVLGRLCLIPSIGMYVENCWNSLKDWNNGKARASEMKAEQEISFGVPSFLVGLNDSLIRALIALEILSRSGNDLQEILKKIFSGTWVYKLLAVFITHGPMHKAELCSRLFPSKKDTHYKLSRGQTFLALNYLLDNKIIIVVKDLGHKKVYDISPEYKLIFQAIFCGNVLALLKPMTKEQ